MTAVRQLKLTFGVTVNRETTNERGREALAYRGILFGVGGGSTNSVDGRGQREPGSGGGSPPSQDSVDSYNLVQEILEVLAS